MEKENSLKIGAIGMTTLLVFIAFVNILANGQTAAGTAQTATGQDTQTNPIVIPANTGNGSGTGTNTSTGSTSTPTASTTKYKDGNYTATAQYYVPEGTSTINVKLAVKNDVVTSVNTTFNEPDMRSKMYDNWFTSAIQTAVVGQKIDQLQLYNVGGASLTTGGFNQALNTILTQAAR